MSSAGNRGSSVALTLAARTPAARPLAALTPADRTLGARALAGLLGARPLASRPLAALTLAVLALLTTGCAASAAEQHPPVVTAAGQQPASGSARPGTAQSGTAQSGTEQSAVGQSVVGLPGLPQSGAARPGPAPTNSIPPSPPVRPEVPSNPELFPQSDSTLQSQPGPPALVPLNPADGQTRDGDPYRPLVFTATNVWLTPTGGETEFDLALDAGRAVGSATQVRVSYDLTGDGNFDRVETYKYFATDPEPGTERYTQGEGLLTSSGLLGELVAGTVRLEIWSALGEGGTTVALADSSVLLPFS